MTDTDPPSEDDKFCSNFQFFWARSLVVPSPRDSVEMTGLPLFFLILSTMNLNLSGLMKLSLSSCFNSSIPATQAKPQVVSSFFTKCCTSIAGTSHSDFASHVFGGGELLFVAADCASGVLYVFSNSFIIVVALSTQDCISRREASSASMESHFQSLVIADLNSGEVVIAWKNASKPVSFCVIEDGLGKLFLRRIMGLNVL